MSEVRDGSDGITITRKDLADIVHAAKTTPEEIAAIISAAITAANAPKPPTKAELAEIEQAQQHRRETADSYKEQKANERHFQEHVCTHEHTKAAGGGTHCVHVRDNDHPGDPGFILCQGCQGRVRPDTKKWHELDPTAIFNTNLFNKLFQDCAQGQGEIIG
jgi:hypothetical protein